MQPQGEAHSEIKNKRYLRCPICSTEANTDTTFHRAGTSKYTIHIFCPDCLIHLYAFVHLEHIDSEELKVRYSCFERGYNVNWNADCFNTLARYWNKPVFKSTESYKGEKEIFDKFCVVFANYKLDRKKLTRLVDFEECCENCLDQVYPNYRDFELFKEIETCGSCSYCGYRVRQVWVK